VDWTSTRRPGVERTEKRKVFPGRTKGGSTMRSHLVTGFAALAVAACASFAPTPGTVVQGRGDPALDLEAVQRAVDRGGRVLLKGGFDFGEAGSVRITRDVEVVGEAEADGKPRTRVRGGQAAFRSLPADAPVAGPRIAIRGIHFDGASWMAVHVAHASSTSITGNVFTGVRPLAFPPSALSQGKPYQMQQAIVVGGVAEAPDKGLPYRAHAVSGPVAITGNEFDLQTAAAKSTIGMAIWVVRTTGARTEITANRVRNAPRNGIEAIDNFRAADGSGEIDIRGNDVLTALDGVPIPSPRAPNGIVAGYFLEPKAALDATRAVPMRIADNLIRLRGQTASSVGLSVLLDKAVVTGNRVVIETPGGIGIAISGSSNHISGNRVEGSGWAGIALTPFQPMTASGNELAGNDFSALTASSANVILAKGANANRIAGSTGSVLDLGEGNATAGLSPVAQAGR
jgi:hypothetical protein